jgi:hypothetical protein
MGYRSYGWLVLPTQIYNKVKESQGPEGILQIWQTEWDSTKQMETNSGEYTILNYNDWKMYESYPDVKKFYELVDKLDSVYDEMVPNQVITPEDPNYMWSVTKTIIGDTTINRFVGPQEITQEWDWVYAEKGEEPDDITIRGSDDFGINVYQEIENAPTNSSDWVFMVVDDKRLADNFKKYVEDFYPMAEIEEEEDEFWGSKTPAYQIWADCHFEFSKWEMQLSSEEKTLLNKCQTAGHFSWVSVVDDKIFDNTNGGDWEIYEYTYLAGPFI